MNLGIFVLIFVSVFLNAIAQIFIKAATNSLGSLYTGNIIESIIRVAFSPFITLGLFSYVLSVGIWIVALSKTQVSIAYPMLSMGYIIVLFISWYFFKEAITLYKVIGIFLIILGIIFISKA